MRDSFISFFFTLWIDKDSEDYAETQAYSVKMYLLSFSIGFLKHLSKSLLLTETICIFAE
ncbi:hypothetical protein FNW54_09795 [Bacteroides sp. HF-5092]|nr:hypothetical protein FNW54_09795 [Bacteroides sp. HF-5092]